MEMSIFMEIFTPGDNSLLLLHAELYLSMNCEQALQDAGEVCQNEPLLPKGHHVQTQALSGLGRSKETLKEFLYCLALNPECNSVKKEAQKVLYSLPQRNVNSNTGESEELPTEVADFECALCMRLLFEPVTMPCGHTFLPEVPGALPGPRSALSRVQRKTFRSRYFSGKDLSTCCRKGEAPYRPQERALI
ncbi:unnamed protein product [Rangifer tarandus platyrhynchus]|uniref:Uncharacterized protein n=1 Tax=Rangifer tarandus platyrhynchus TaxID=3082113 RepID=A0AC59ZSJ7_RANTA